MLTDTDNFMLCYVNRHCEFNIIEKFGKERKENQLKIAKIGTNQRKYDEAKPLNLTKINKKIYENKIHSINKFLNQYNSKKIR